MNFKFNNLYKMIMQQYVTDFSNIPESTTITDTTLAEDLKLNWAAYKRTSEQVSTKSLFEFPFYYKEQSNSKSNMYNSVYSIIAFWFNDQYYSKRINYVKSEIDKQKFVYSDISKNNRELAAIKFNIDLIVNEGDPNFNYTATEYVWHRLQFPNIETVKFIYAISNIYKYSEIIAQEEDNKVGIAKIRKDVQEYIDIANGTEFTISKQQRDNILAIIDSTSSPLMAINLTIKWIIENFSGMSIDSTINIYDLAKNISTRKSIQTQIADNNIQPITAAQKNIIIQANSMKGGWSYLSTNLGADFKKKIKIEIGNKKYLDIELRDLYTASFKQQYFKYIEKAKIFVQYNVDNTKIITKIPVKDLVFPTNTINN